MKRRHGRKTEALGGAGLWSGMTDDGVYFSELSPRPHDTGMVTLGNTKFQ
jgi:phosphoribosylglycinamide formyltransferase 2